MMSCCGFNLLLKANNLLLYSSSSKYSSKQLNNGAAARPPQRRHLGFRKGGCAIFNSSRFSLPSLRRGTTMEGCG